MKFFSTFLTAIFVTLLGVVGTMAQTSDQVISAIQSFTTAAQNLDAAVVALNPVTFPTMGFVIPNSLLNLTVAIDAFNDEFLPSTPPYPDDVAAEVLDDLTIFVNVYQDLLNDIIGKHSLAAMFAFAVPIAAALPGLESVVDTFVCHVINLIPTRAGPANVLLNGLSAIFQSAIGTYDS